MKVPRAKGDITFSRHTAVNIAWDSTQCDVGLQG
jgi:hypothetical protein